MTSFGAFFLILLSIVLMVGFSIQARRVLPLAWIMCAIVAMFPRIVELKYVPAVSTHGWLKAFDILIFINLIIH
jgi:hypothetical protein